MSKEIDNEAIEIQEERAMVYLPKDAVEVSIGAKVYIGGGALVSIEKKMDMHEIREAFRKAEEGYIDEDDRFELTEKGKKFLEDMMYE